MKQIRKGRLSALPRKAATRALTEREALNDVTGHPFITECYATFQDATSLFFASISSSAPVIAKLDMHEYNDIVADAYALESVGGSSECRQAIAVGHKNIGHLMNTSYGRRWLAMIFPHVESAEWLEDVDNQRSFAADGVTNANSPHALGQYDWHVTSFSRASSGRRPSR